MMLIVSGPSCLIIPVNSFGILPRDANYGKSINHLFSQSLRWAGFFHCSKHDLRKSRGYEGEYFCNCGKMIIKF